MPSIIDCPPSQDRLDNVFADMPKGAELPIIETMFSPQNMNGLQTRVVKENNHLVDLQVLHQPRELESTVSSTVEFLCEDGAVKGDNEFTYTLDTSLGVKSAACQFDYEQTKRRCESDQAYLDRQVAYQLDVLERALETQYAGELATKQGFFAGDDTNQDGSPIVGAGPKVISTSLPTSSAPDPQALSEIRFTTETAGYPAPAVIFGGKTLWTYLRKVDAGCCNDQGIDLRTMFDQNSINYAYSNRMVTALGGANERFLMLALGSVVPLWYNRFPIQINPSPNGATEFGVKVFSRRGIPFDLSWSVKCHKVHFSLGLATQLFGLPNNMFEAGDRLEQVNLVNEFEIVNV